MQLEKLNTSIALMEHIRLIYQISIPFQQHECAAELAVSNSQLVKVCPTT